MASITKNSKGERRIVFYLPSGERKAVYVGKMALKQVESIQSKIESTVTAMAAQVSIPLDVAQWLGKIGDDIYLKLSNAGLVEERTTSAKSVEAQAGAVPGCLR